jgi:hypothetical protein
MDLDRSARTSPAAARWPALRATIAIGVSVNLRRLTTWVFAGVFLLIAFLLYRGPLRFGGMTARAARSWPRTRATPSRRSWLPSASS